MGTTLFIRLLSRFGTPADVLGASEAALSDVVGPKLAERIRAYRGVVDVDRQLMHLAQYGASLLTMDDPAYPLRLAEIYDPPLVLFCRGSLAEADHQAVALVGTRKPTAYGARMARNLAYELASHGITIVSGMAEGIDTAAHEGAMEAGGRTIAVLGCGVDIVYPPSNAALMHRIVQHGAVVSSFEMGVKPSKGHFPYRNRIISGLSMGTVVVEAPIGSGALITARNAAEQGREVYAVPGEAGAYNSRGPHALIREGAKLVETAQDILVELDIEAANRPPARQNTPAPRDVVAPPPRPAAPAVASPTGQAASTPSPAANVTPLERAVLDVLSQDGSFVDEIAAAARMSVSEA
ncbi:MAG: DNA-protecting protein DprA, partial [Candidatus Hydrogenedentes bacterium]|nr:DNA-protecting protein DprA [Candidatus Hydrogenedentota bacterium]